MRSPPLRSSSSSLARHGADLVPLRADRLQVMGAREGFIKASLRTRPAFSAAPSRRFGGDCREETMALMKLTSALAVGITGRAHRRYPYGAVRAFRAVSDAVAPGADHRPHRHPRRANWRCAHHSHASAA